MTIMTVTHPLELQLDRFAELIGDRGQQITSASVQERCEALGKWCDLRTRAATRAAAILALGSFTTYLFRTNKLLCSAVAIVTALTSGYCLKNVYFWHTQIRERLTCCDTTLQMLTETTKVVQDKLCEVSNGQVNDKHTTSHAHTIGNDVVNGFFTGTEPTEISHFAGMAERAILRDFLNIQYSKDLLNLKTNAPHPSTCREQHLLSDQMANINKCLQRLRYGCEGRIEPTLYFHMDDSGTRPRLFIAPYEEP